MTARDQPAISRYYVGICQTKDFFLLTLYERDNPDNIHDVRIHATPGCVTQIGAAVVAWIVDGRRIAEFL
jgi:hypothetical protein